jgi:hypothetical protein
MKTRSIACMSLLALCVAAAAGQTPEQQFQSANVLFQQGKIAEARDVYENILKSGYVSGELYFNLGNAWYRTGSISRAILNYERARKYIPGDEDLGHNLQLMNLMITDRIEPIPRLFVWDYWDALTGAFSLRGISWLAYGLLVLTIVMVAGTILDRRYMVRKTALILSVVAGVLLVVSAVVFAAKWTEVTRTDEGVLMAQVVSVKNSPDVKGTDAFVLHSGVKVRIVDAVAGWLKVRIADGKVGWVESSSLERI